MCLIYYAQLFPTIRRGSQNTFLTRYLVPLVCLFALYGGNLMADLVIEKQDWAFFNT